MGRRQNRDAKVDRKSARVYFILVRLDLKVIFPENLPTGLPRFTRSSSPDLIFGALTRTIEQLKPCIGLASDNIVCIMCLYWGSKSKESAMVRPKGRTRELILHNRVVCNDQPSLAARTERQAKYFPLGWRLPPLATRGKRSRQASELVLSRKVRQE
jgi:hypothetical protein